MYDEPLAKLMPYPETQEKERVQRRRGVLTQLALRRENERYRDTTGVSQNNHDQGFIPAYQNSNNGETVISRFADGRPAPVHILDGLPASWIAQRDADGHVTRTQPGIIAGFLRNGVFYTREEACQACAH